MAFQTTNMSPDWSQLPPELLGRVAANHLTAVEDFIMGSCVCRAWYSAFSMVKEIWSPNGCQVPWLMLAEPKNDMTSTNDSNLQGRRKMFNPSRDKCYNLMLPEILGRRCWGSDHGWVVSLGLDLEMHAFNPLTKVRQRLPSLRTFRHPAGGTEDDYVWNRNNYVKKICVLKMPLCGKDHHCNLVKHQYVVMAIHGKFHWLSYAKFEDASWMPIETSTTKMVLDVAFCNGLILMLCAGSYMTLNMVDGHVFCGSSRPLQAVGFLPSPITLFSAPYSDLNFNMFESFGDLLLVRRCKIDEDLGELGHDIDYLFGDRAKDERTHWLYKTEKFLVFSFDFHVKQWKEVKDLGDRALFAGENGWISVQASNVINCKRNSIYFADDERGRWSLLSGSAGHDMGVYNVENGSIQPLYQGDDWHSKFSGPFWFMPKLNCS